MERAREGREREKWSDGKSDKDSRHKSWKQRQPLLCNVSFDSIPIRIMRPLMPDTFCPSLNPLLPIVALFGKSRVDFDDASIGRPRLMVGATMRLTGIISAGPWFGQSAKDRKGTKDIEG